MKPRGPASLVRARLQRLAPMKTTTSAGRRHPSLGVATARLGVVAVAGAITVACLVSAPWRSAPAAAPPTFVDRALGPPSSDASLERRLATGATLAIDTRASTPASATRRSRSRRAAPARQLAALRDGVTRATSFGHESILFGINRAEQFLTVDRRQGTRTWSWQLDATHGDPRLVPDGGVSFTRARAALPGFRILPVAILDRRGRDITPAGLRWSLDGEAGWTLGLRLDDRRLPVPYLIDPIALIAACGSRPAGRHDELHRATSTGSSSLGITKPSAAVAGDVMVAQLTVRSTGAITRAGRLEPDRLDGAGRCRARSSRRFSGIASTAPSRRRSRSRGRRQRRRARAGSSRTRASTRSSASTRGKRRTSMTSGGTAATGNPAGLAITTSAANEMLQAAYGVANGVTVTQSGGQGLVREWTVASAGATKVTAGFSDGVQAAAGAPGTRPRRGSRARSGPPSSSRSRTRRPTGRARSPPFHDRVGVADRTTQTLTYTPAAGKHGERRRLVRRPSRLDPAAATTTTQPAT